jgi:hypothetical protein
VSAKSVRSAVMSPVSVSIAAPSVLTGTAELKLPVPASFTAATR